MLRRVLLLAVLLSGALAPSAAAAVPPGWVGMLIQDPMFSKGKGFNTERELRVMERAKVGSVRAAFYGWETMPDPDLPPDLSVPDEVVLRSAEHGIRVLPVLLGVPPWAREFPDVTYSAPTAKGRAKYAEVAKAFVRRYGRRGTLWADHPEVEPLPMRTFQIWNEVRLARFWKGKQQRVRGYVKLLKQAYRAIKSLDRRATVIAAGEPGQYPTFVRDLYRYGAKRSFDAIGVHPFTFEVPNVQLILERHRRVLDQHGDRRKPIYITELSWPSAYKKTSFQYGYETTEREQAVKVREAYRMLDRNRRRLKIAGVWWASWVTRDNSKKDSFDYSGLRKYNAKNAVRNKPAYYAFIRTIRRLVAD